jgi:hypothetical protein
MSDRPKLFPATEMLSQSTAYINKLRACLSSIFPASDRAAARFAERAGAGLLERLVGRQRGLAIGGKPVKLEHYRSISGHLAGIRKLRPQDFRQKRNVCRT